MTGPDKTDARRALVWDIGGVLYRYFTEVLLDEHPELAAQGIGPTAATADEAYEQMQAGELHEHAYLDTVRDHLATLGIDRDPTTSIDWERHTRPAAWGIVEAAHAAGRRQALLTNDAAKWQGEDWLETWPRAELFDEVVDVAHLGVRKPAPEPYREVASRLGLPTGACLFIDDMAVNCQGAEAVGMASHHVDVNDAEASLRALAARTRLDRASPVDSSSG